MLNPAGPKIPYFSVDPNKVPPAEPLSFFLIYSVLPGAPEEIRTPDPQIRSLVLSKLTK